MQAQFMVSRVLTTPMGRQTFFWLKTFCLPLSAFCLIPMVSQAQRLVVQTVPESPPTLKAPELGPTPDLADSPTQILKVYPDGTKKVVPLGSLNHRDDGDAYGGPPQLSVYPGPNPIPALSTQSPERLSVAPIGNSEPTTNLNANLPASPDSLGESSIMVANDLMGGGSSAPIDPLAGAPQKNTPPLQTVSGKPAPLVDSATTLQLGEWESFFLNAAVGGSYQGQLTARRVWNGNNRQAYPYGGPGTTPPPAYPYNEAQVSGENFTFNPGFRLDLEFGYNFYEWLGLGLQTGLTYNGINQYNVTFNDSPGGGLPAGPYNMSADGDLVQVPIQLNGILRWPGQMKLRPFVGGGIGAVWQQLDVNNYYLANTDIQGNYCRSAFQFGWNAQAGLTYTMEPGLDFYGAFKMLSAFMPVIGNYQFENTYNFAVEVGIQSRF